ncbi:TolC family protein [Pontibacter sp. 13R65]|uniref:TolC family protein n=1 Tax=Pontibacter sp. 13R65 TaxID=3127458 RepID=UPI00301C9603
MIKRFLTLSLTLLLLKPAMAQETPQARRLNLQEAISYALDHNEDIQKASLDQISSRYQVKEARSAGLPQVEIAGQGVKALKKPRIALPADFNPEGTGPLVAEMGTDYNILGGFSASQLLFSKSYFVGLKAAKSAEDLYQIRKEMTTEEVIYNVGSAYYQVLQTQEQFNTIRANFEQLEQLERIMQLQYENDLVKKVDVNRIKVNKINLENQKKSLMTSYEQQENVLKFFMGMPLEQPIMLSGSAEDNLLPVQPMLARAEEPAHKRAQFQVLNKQKELKLLEMENTRAGYYPTLSAFGNYNYQTMYNGKLLGNSTASWFPTSQVGLQLTIPVFDGFRKKAQVQQREVEMQKLDIDMKQFNKNTQVELTNAIAQLHNSQSAILAQEENVKLAQEVYDTTNQLYKEGLSPLTDLLNAETSLREAQTNLNNERLKYKLAELNYLQATGDLENLTK